MDFLVAAFEDLAAQPAAVLAHGLAWVAVRTSSIHRLEFETQTVGRYAQLLHRLARLNVETRRRVATARSEPMRSLDSHTDALVALDMQVARSSGLGRASASLTKHCAAPRLPFHSDGQGGMEPQGRVSRDGSSPYTDDRSGR